MSYRVIKTIKGRPYFYEQSTYRVGQTVRTVSRYIGPAAPSIIRADTRQGVAATLSPPAETPAAPVNTTSPDGAACGTRAAGGAAPVRHAATRPIAPPVPLTVSLPLDRYHISGTALEREYRRQAGQLARCGLDVSRLPQITVAHGAAVACRRTFGGNYRVTLPKRSGNRATFKAAYSEAVARASIDLLRQQQPDRFGRIASQFDQSFRDTTAALTRYALTTDCENRFVAVLVLRLFGRTVQLRNWKHRGDDHPERLGLASYGARKNWQDEAAGLLGEITRRGFPTVRAKWAAELAKARTAERHAIEAWQATGRFSIRRLWAKRKIKRATARAALIAETANKVHMLGEVFGLDRSG